MKLLIIVFLWICTHLCVPFSGNAQQKNSVVDSSLFYQREAINYEKQIFSHQGDIESLNQLLLKKAECYQLLEDYRSALFTINRANFYEGSDGTKFNLYYKAALYAYLNQEYKFAQGYLLEMQYYIEDESLIQKSLFLEILIHFSLEEWEAGREKFRNYASINNIDSLTTLSLINKPSPKLKSLNKAENISVFLPGMGQWYAGYPIKGVASGLLQLGFAGWGAYSILNGYFFSGAFTGVAIFYMFYTGGMRHAKYLAEQTNLKRKESFVTPYKELMMRTEYNKKGER